MSDLNQTSIQTAGAENEQEGLDNTGTVGMDIVSGPEHDDIVPLGGDDVVAGGAGRRLPVR